MHQFSNAALSQVRWRTRIGFAEKLVSATVARLEDETDLSPIVIRANRKGLGVLETIRDVGKLLFLEPVYIDISNTPDHSVQQESADLIRRLRTSRKIIVLTGWQTDLTKAQDTLIGVSHAAKDDGSIVVVHSIGDAEDSDPAREVGLALGSAIWRDLTYIEVDAPEILDDAAIARLQVASD